MRGPFLCGNAGAFFQVCLNLRNSDKPQERALEGYDAWEVLGKNKEPMPICIEHIAHGVALRTLKKVK
jgi:hypothetical protein